MTETMTPQQFHARLAAQFAEYQGEVSVGVAPEFSFLGWEGAEYNAWLEHRHGWPLTEDLLCGPALSAYDPEVESFGEELPYADCSVCSRLVELYREYCAKARIDQARARSARREQEEDE